MIKGFINYAHPRILVEAILDVNVRVVRIKKFIDPDIVMMHILQKKMVNKEILVLVYTRRTIYSL